LLVDLSQIMTNRGGYAMPKSTLHALSQPESERDPLHELIRTGARKLIGKAVDAEITTMIEHYADLKAPSVPDQHC
jgi:hypothetical protein